jgi:hypothetical protein
MSRGGLKAVELVGSEPPTLWSAHRAAKRDGVREDLDRGNV